MTATIDPVVDDRAAVQRSQQAELSVPTLVSVEGDSYVFVAVIEDPTLSGASNWLSQTCRVAPHTDQDGRLCLDITERYHVDDDGQHHVAFEDEFSVTIPTDTGRHGLPEVRSALRRWFREAYPDDSIGDSSAD